MSKKAKFFIFLIIILLIFVLYLIIISEPVQQVKQTKNKESSNTINKIDLWLLEKSYKAKVKIILANYLRLAQNENLDIKQVGQAKNQLLAIKVPTKFKDLHLNLVLALTKMESYLEGGNEAYKKESQQLIDQEKKKYEWLN